MSSTIPELCTDNPAVRFERFFEKIWQSRMQGLPILNPALRVQAVGFQPWQDGWLGILITPWFMNLLWVPAREHLLTEPEGTSVVQALPAGQCEFFVYQEEELGAYLACSLFSPMNGFPDQEQAQAMATAVLEALFEPPSSDEPVAEAAPARPALSRRDLLRGAFARRG